MNISGISALRYLLQNQDASSSQNTLTDVLLNAAASRSSLSTLPTQGESFHMEIELTDGTKVTIDYARQGVLNKTSYELGQYGNYTYGNSSFTPESTANRILDFARALWDGSPEKLETLADAMEEGVSQARRTLGSLPNWLDAMIGRTVELLRAGFDEMRSEAQAAA